MDEEDKDKINKQSEHESSSIEAQQLKTVDESEEMGDDSMENNLDYVEEVIENDDFLSSIKHKVTFSNLNISSISQQDTNLEIMLTEEFWNSVVGETVLYFECDSMLCSNSKFYIP